MSGELLPLADAVLPLIRSRSRDVWRYSLANAHGQRMHEGIDILEAALDDPESMPGHGIRVPAATEAYTVVHKALASSIRVIARADDSAGIIGDACRRLTELHPRAAAAARVPQATLAEWVYDFHFDPEVDYFLLDPVAYAPALGEKGLRRLRARIDALRAEIPPPDPDAGRMRFDHRETLVRWFDQGFGSSRIVERLRGVWRYLIYPVNAPNSIRPRQWG